MLEIFEERMLYFMRKKNILKKIYIYKKLKSKFKKNK